MHRAEVRISRGAEGKTGRAFIADMDEENALQVISKFITETFLYTVSIWDRSGGGLDLNEGKRTAPAWCLAHFYLVEP